MSKINSDEMDEVYWSTLDKILQGLKACKENKYAKGHDFEARIGESVVKEMLGMKLIEVRAEGNEKGYVITDSDESFYRLRKKQNIFRSLIMSRLKSV